MSDLARRGRAGLGRRRSKTLAAIRVGVLAGSMAGPLGCGGLDTQARPDPSLRAHAVEDEADARALAYVRAAGEAHELADRALAAGDVEGALEHISRALDAPAPGGDPAAIAELELAARMGELALEASLGREQVLADLRARLAPRRSLPRDRSAARALVALGDLAAQLGDEALAAGSYARAVRLMSQLRKELAP